MTYEALLTASDDLGLITKEKDLQAFDGRIKGNRIAIRRSIPTQRMKACILAEELGHYFTTTGSILDDSWNAKRQERTARTWAYNLQIGLSGLIDAYKAGCRGVYEIAEYLDVPERFLTDCLTCYRTKYGTQVRYKGYVIRFDPCIDVIPEKEAE